MLKPDVIIFQNHLPSLNCLGVKIMCVKSAHSRIQVFNLWPVYTRGNDDVYSDT